MDAYIPDDLYKNIDNKPKVEAILSTVTECCIRIPGIKNVEDARREIRDLGEDRVAEAIIVG